MVPLLFPVCGRAQGVAARLACDAASGTDGDAAERAALCPTERAEVRAAEGAAARAARRRVVAAETVHEHLWRVLLDWPRLIDEAPRVEAFASVRQRLVGAPDWNVARLAVRELLAREVYGAPAGHWRAATAREAGFSAWLAAGSTTAARLLQTVRDESEAYVARGVALLPATSAKDVACEVVAYADVARNAEPEWDGAARETGALARHVADPLVARLLADDRPPALARLAARLVELDALTADEDPQVAHGVVAFDGGGTSDDGALDRSARDGAVRDESGVARGDGVASGVADAIAWVDTARGLLVHRVGLVDGRVARWQIVAPTEWNFHPRGALATELPGMRARDEATLRRRVSLLAQTLDPCVRFDVEIGHA